MRVSYLKTYDPYYVYLIYIVYLIYNITLPKKNLIKKHAIMTNLINNHHILINNQITKFFTF
jgi:hypothetical protein